MFLADSWIDHPTIRFLVPDLPTPRTIDPTATIPLLKDEPFIYFARPSGTS